MTGTEVGVPTDDPGDELSQTLARAGIRDWIARTGRALLHMTPVAILTSMTASALAPILIPAFTGATSVADVQIILAQVGNLGTGYLTTLIQQLADRTRDRKESSGLTEETLREVLRACLEDELSGPRMAEARATITALVRAVDGVNEALAATRGGAPGLTLHLVQAVNDLSHTATEFRDLRDDLLSSLGAILRDTTYLRAVAQDTYDELCRISIEVGTMRLLISRRPVPERAQHPDGNRATTIDGIPSSDDDCPYRGLATFEIKHARWFYGRDRLVATLVGELNERLHSGTPLMVTGASGAGKSSVLRAGLIPQLRRGALTAAGSADWPYMIMTPTGYPMRQLGVEFAVRAGITSSQVIAQIKEEPARAQLIVRQLLRAQDEDSNPANAPPDAARRLILVIDQFEEVFTQCRDGRERKAFIDAVCAITHGSRHDPPPALVVLGMHTSFLEHCTAHPELAPSLVNPVIVGPMTRAELRDAIEAPAVLDGLTVEPGLTETMLHDIEAVASRDGSDLLTYDPGKLPLLAHALLETWKRRAGNQLTLAAYQTAGGVHEALAETANRVYESLDTVGQGVARRLLLNLARPDEAGDTRRAMDREALLAELPAADAPVAVGLLARLERERLLTADAGNVQITHEALLRYWPALADWLAEDRESLRKRQLLAEQAREWEESGRQLDRLPRGDVLAGIKAWLDADHSADLGDRTRNFLHAAERRARRAQRARASFVALLIWLVVVTGGFALVFLHQRMLAGQAQTLAQVRQLLAEAAQLHLSQPENSLLLDLEAYRMKQNGETDNALLSAQAGFFADVLPNPSGAAHSVAYNAAGSLIAVGAQDAVTVWDTPRHRLTATFNGQSPFYAVAFAPGGELLAGGEQDGQILIWNLASHREVANLSTTNTQSGASVNAIAFTPNGSMLATAGDSDAITLWNTSNWRPARSQPPRACDIVNGLAISPDGAQLAAACSDHRVLVWQLARLASGPVPLVGHTGSVLAVTFSPVSAVLASAGDDGTVRIWDTKARAVRAVLPGSTAGIDALTFHPGGALLASGDVDGVVRLWDLDTLSQAAALTGPANTVGGLAFSPDGRTIASADADGTVGLWIVAAPPQPGSQPAPAVVAATRAGSTITAAPSGQAIGLWNPAQALAQTTLRMPDGQSVTSTNLPNLVPGANLSLALSPDGADLAAAPPHPEPVVDLWSTAGSPAPMILHAPNPLTSLATQHAASGEAIVAAGSSAGLIYVWDVPQRGAPTLTPLNGNLPAQVTAVALSPDGRLLAGGCADGSLLLASRNKTDTWITTSLSGGPNSAVTSVAFSADGRLLAAGSDDGSVQLWDVGNPADPVRLPKLTGPGGSIVSLAFSDRSTLAAAADDDSIHLWNVRDSAAPAPLATLSGLASPVSIAWRPRTQTLVGVAPDGTPLTWNINPNDIANRICEASDLPADTPALIAPDMPGITYQPVCP